jgi:hypothetical protein
MLGLLKTDRIQEYQSQDIAWKSDQFRAFVSVCLDIVTVVQKSLVTGPNY